MTDPQHPPVPRISARDAPRFRGTEHRTRLAASFQGQGQDYDRLRPGYPDAVVTAMLEHSRGEAAPRVVDLGAGTGKLSWALASRGAEVVAIDPSRAMLDAAEAAAPGDVRGTLTTGVGSAEESGLPGGCADLVTVAQAWHWFDAPAASAEVERLLAPGGSLVLVWNMLDVTIPWVHRLSRIMHAGDIHREDFEPEVAAPFILRERTVHAWEDPMSPRDVIDLSRTRSYMLSASDDQRSRVLDNLDWYLHEHLGHEEGAEVRLPYRTDLFVYGIPDGDSSP